MRHEDRGLAIGMAPFDHFIICLRLYTLLQRELDILKGDYEAASQLLAQRQTEVDKLRHVIADLVMQQARQANREARYACG